MLEGERQGAFCDAILLGSKTPLDDPNEFSEHHFYPARGPEGGGIVPPLANTPHYRLIGLNFRSLASQ